MTRRVSLLATAVLLAVLTDGCGPPAGPPPTTRDEYGRLSGDDARAYPRQTILMHNLQRAMDNGLETQQRVESMRLAVFLAEGSPDVLDPLAGLLADPEAPDLLQREVLGLLLEEDYPGMARYVLKAVPHMQRGQPLREEIFKWLIRHPEGSALSDVVRLWADEPVAGPDEPRFRQIVEQMAGMAWDAALLDRMNSQNFLARGSALEILIARLPDNTLRQRIVGTPARSRAMHALQICVERFGYLPANGRDLLLAVWNFAQQYRSVPDAFRLYRQWHSEYGYNFDIRDFHLLSRLAADRARASVNRSELILELGNAFDRRQHARHRPSASGAADDYVDLFAVHIESLTVADLWNLHLLNELLSRSMIQRALRIVAERDLADKGSAWGGLVRYEKGEPAAKLYGPDRHRSNDLTYVASELMQRDARDALCRFHTHFEKINNLARAGPEAAELLHARTNNYYGLALTSISERGFCAHYYNPKGIVVSLGVFPFRQ